MILLVSGATKTVKELAPHKNLGCLLVPNSGNSIESFCGLPWAADNGCFGGFNPPAFVKMMERIKDHKPLFVTCPDVVADAEKTMGLFDIWYPVIKWYRLPIAYVLQDGQDKVPIPWSEIASIFIGGTTEWKLSEEARRYVTEAKVRGKWVHMGRVNSFRRIRYAVNIGCDSIDGTGYSMFPDQRIPRALKLLSALDKQKQMTIFDEESAM